MDDERSRPSVRVTQITEAPRRQRFPGHVLTTGGHDGERGWEPKGKPWPT